MARVGIVFLGYYFGVSTSVIQTASTLAENGFDVDIFLDADNAAAAPLVTFASQRVRIIIGQKIKPAGDKTSKKQIKECIPDSLWSMWSSMKRPLRPLYYWLNIFSNKGYSPEDYMRDYATEWKPYLDMLCSHAAEHDYFALIGVEATGLIAASYTRNRANRPETALIYYNMELLQDSIFLPMATRLRKLCEVNCARSCLFTVIADEYRGAVFSNSTGVSNDKLRYLTVSTSGQAVHVKGRYFRDLFRLPENIKIIVYAGNIRPWAMCREIVESVQNWPSDCVLVMHTWRSDFSTDEYCQNLLRIADPKRVFFSTTPVSATMLPEVLSSADVGIAFYEPIDENFTEIGSSSNKLAQYAQVGLPVICNDFPSLRRVMDRYRSGVCAEHPRNIGSALSIIFADYSSYRQGVFDSYQQHYDFKVAFAPLLEEFKRMRDTRAC